MTIMTIKSALKVSKNKKVIIRINKGQKSYSKFSRTEQQTVIIKPSEFNNPFILLMTSYFFWSLLVINSLSCPDDKSEARERMASLIG